MKQSRTEKKRTTLQRSSKRKEFENIASKSDNNILINCKRGKVYLDATLHWAWSFKRNLFGCTYKYTACLLTSWHDFHFTQSWYFSVQTKEIDLTWLHFIQVAPSCSVEMRSKCSYNLLNSILSITKSGNFSWRGSIVFT